MVRKNYPFHEKDVKKMTKLVTNVMLSPFSLLNGISSTKQSSGPASFLPEGYSSNKGFRKSYVNKKANTLRYIQISCHLFGMISYALGVPMFFCILIFGLIDFIVALCSTFFIKSLYDGTIIDKTSDYDESHFIKKITVRVFLAILLSEPYLFYPMIFSCLGWWKGELEIITIILSMIFLMLKAICLDDIWRILIDIKSDLSNLTPPQKKRKRCDGAETWVFINRPEIFDLHKWLQNHRYVDCIQRNKVAIGDIVYVYIGDPVSKIKYKMHVSKVDVAFRELPPMSVLAWNKAPIDMDQKCCRLQLVSENQSGNLSLKHLRKMGVIAMMLNPFRLDEEIANRVEKYFDKQGGE